MWAVCHRAVALPPMTRHTGTLLQKVGGQPATGAVARVVVGLGQLRCDRMQQLLGTERFLEGVVGSQVLRDVEIIPLT